MRKHFRTFLELIKVRITIAVAFTTATGYMLYKNTFDLTAVYTIIGLFLIACGSAVINHVQEYRTDMLMKRTQNRPIPSGRISKTGASIISFLLVLCGSFLIYFTSNFTAVLIGWLALIWYNLIYTPLKKKSAFATIPGAVIGALPPLVGWVAAGGYIFDYQAIIIAFFFFIWQVPHFWLLLLKYGKDYEDAGFPSLTMLFNGAQIKRNTFIWIVSTAISALMFSAFSITENGLINIGILFITLWLTISSLKLLRYSNQVKFNPMLHFRNINIFVLVIMICLTIDSLI